MVKLHDKLVKKDNVVKVTKKNITLYQVMQETQMTEDHLEITIYPECLEIGQQKRKENSCLEQGNNKKKHYVKFENVTKKEET